jgi:Mg2+-importing ATPase
MFLLYFLLTGTLSFIHERNVGKVVEKLQSMIALKSTVLRGGIAKEIVPSQIIPGDIMRLDLSHCHL